MLWLGHLLPGHGTGTWALGRIKTFEYWPIYLNYIPWWETDIPILRASLHMLWLGHLLPGNGTWTCSLG